MYNLDKLSIVCLVLLTSSAFYACPRGYAEEGEADSRLHLSPSELYCHLVNQAPQRLTYRGQPFRSWQDELRNKLVELLGWVPEKKCDLNVRELEQTETEEYTKTKLVFTSEPGADVPCYLLIPKKAREPIPVCICLQGPSTGTSVALGSLGAVDGAGGGDYALQAIKEGLAALCIDRRCWRHYRRWSDDPVRATVHSYLVGRTMIEENVYDVQRAIDMLEKEYPQLDAANIAIAGCAGDGAVAFWAAAADRRIGASMPCGYFCTFADGQMKVRHDMEGYIPRILQWMEMYDVAGLIAPRPLVIVAREGDPLCPLAAVRQAYDKAKVIYAAAGAPDKIRLLVVKDGQEFPQTGSWKALEELMGLKSSQGKGDRKEATGTEAVAAKKGETPAEKLALSSFEFHRQLVDQAPLELTYRGQPFVPWRDELRKKAVELLGRVPEKKCDLNVRELEQVETDQYTRTKLVFTSEPYADVPCYVLIPKKARKPAPVCICLQGHKGIDRSAGAKGDANDQDFAIQAVEEGFAALCVEQRYYAERQERKQESRWGHGCFDAVVHSLALGRTAIGEKVYDIQRAIDMLEQEYPQLDTTKIVIMGNCGGGLVAAWATAMDKRISACMPGACFCNLADGVVETVHCPEAYIPRILQWMDRYDLAGLIAPRPLVITNGDKDPLYTLLAAQKAYAKAKTIYAAAGAPDNVRLIVGKGGHRFFGRKEGSWKLLKELMGLEGEAAPTAKTTDGPRKKPRLQVERRGFRRLSGLMGGRSDAVPFPAAHRTSGTRN